MGVPARAPKAEMKQANPNLTLKQNAQSARIINMHLCVLTQSRWDPEQGSLAQVQAATGLDHREYFAFIDFKLQYTHQRQRKTHIGLKRPSLKQHL